MQVHVMLVRPFAQHQGPWQAARSERPWARSTSTDSAVQAS